MTWRCRTCGETFTKWAKAEKHVDQVHGGARLEIQPELFDHPPRPVVDTKPL